MGEVIAGWDAIGANLDHAPPGQGATYVTGSEDIAATPAQLLARPGIITVCQDAAGSRVDADVIDDEPGADSDSGSVGWYRKALANWVAGKTPGQRHPAFYRDESGLATLTPAVETANLAEPVPLWLADWNLTMTEAEQVCGTRRGPFLIVGVQFARRARWDSDWWLTSWLDAVSGGTLPPPPPSAPTFTEDIMQDLPTLALGATGDSVRTLQGLVLARGGQLGRYGPGRNGIDGKFGELTESAVKIIQADAGLDPNGVADHLTWPVLAGV